MKKNTTLTCRIAKDEAGSPHPSGWGAFTYTQSSCYVCHRDVCSDCSILTDDMKTEEVYTDYPLRICNHCWNDLKEFRTELTELLDDFESKKIAIYAKWKEGSLKVN